ncbi:hypothetical protein OAK65_02610 [Synechococcus sp. AH-551-N17]|nr:hypothetical protein [Synechococcus sp. AH-551-N17]
MENTGTFYDSETLDTVLAQTFDLIRQGRPADADALLAEYGLREWLCEPVL